MESNLFLKYSGVILFFIFRMTQCLKKLNKRGKNNNDRMNTENSQLNKFIYNLTLQLGLMAVEYKYNVEIFIPLYLSSNSFKITLTRKRCNPYF